MGGSVERLRKVDPRVWDAALAGVALVIGVLAIRFTEPGGPGATREEDLLAYVLVVVGTVPIAFRRRAPLVVAPVVAAAACVYAVLGYAAGTWPTLLIALYSVAAYRPWRDVLRVGVPVGAVASVVIYGEGANWVEVLLGGSFVAVLPMVLGRLTWDRRVRVERDRETAAREAVAAERVRIARELHDVVAHAMGVMVVQAGAARSVVERDPAAASEALLEVERAGRTGLAEMRRLVDVLRSDRDETALAPQPGLALLDRLLEQVRAAGLPVEATIEGTPRPLPPGVDVSVYRVIQEALTNSLKHAGGARARVRLRYEPDAVDVEVTDDGRGPGDPGDRPGGHGLVGMRERVALFGGRLEAGPGDHGGFSVRARLPVVEAT